MQHLQETGGGLAIMVKRALQTSHPPSCPPSVSPRLWGCCIFHSPYTLPSSVSPKSFAYHSYENTGGVGYSSHSGTTLFPQCFSASLADPHSTLLPRARQ